MTCSLLERGSGGGEGMLLSLQQARRMIGLFLVFNAVSRDGRVRTKHTGHQITRGKEENMRVRACVYVCEREREGGRGRDRDRERMCCCCGFLFVFSDSASTLDYLQFQFI